MAKTLKNPEGFVGKEHLSHRQLMMKFGVGLEWYNAKFAEQNGCCAVCGRHQSEFARRFHIDHNHKTGQLRALLCPNCNTVLGKVNEDVVILAKLADYIEKWNL